MTTRRGFYGWKLVFFLWLLDFLNMGFPLYGGVVINTYMLHEISMSRSWFGLGFTLLNIFVGIPSIAVAGAIGRWGIRKTFGIGSALLFLGAVWMWLVASKPWHYWLGFGVVTGTGISFGTVIPAATAVTRWFNRYRGRAMALTLSASGIAGLIVAPLINRILSENGGKWRTGWQIVASVAVISALLGFFFVKERPEDLGQPVDGEEGRTSARASSASRRLATDYPWEAREAYGTFAYWMILVGAIACQFPFFLFTAHWLLHLKAAGIAPSAAAWTMGLFTGFSVVGRMVGGWLMDRMVARLAFLAGLFCYLIGSFLAVRVSADALWIAIGAAILYGTGFGWTFICLNTITGHYYGPAAFPKLSGTLLVLAAIFCCPAGYLGGRISDLHGSYFLAFALNSLVASAGIVAMFFARRPVPPREKAPLLLHESAPAD